MKDKSFTGSFECSNINLDFFDKLSCDFFDIYFVSFDNFEILRDEIPDRIILIPHRMVQNDRIYKIVDKDLKLNLYKKIKSNLEEYRGKKEIY